jgi:hypothetical protein
MVAIHMDSSIFCGQPDLFRNEKTSLGRFLRWSTPIDKICIIVHQYGWPDSYAPE